MPRVRDDHRSSYISQQQPYQYTPLQTSSPEIRLLTLLPGSLGTDIHCRLHTQNLRRNPPPCYEALSYAWGSVENQVVIYVGDGTLLVTRSLADALYHLRYPDRPRTLWIDAICVNQGDLNERSQQVARMADIFTLAERVVAWLGLEAQNSTRALGALNLISSMIDVDYDTLAMKPSEEARTSGQLHWADQNMTIPFKSQELDLVHHLLKRAWFERLWVQQEIILATDAILMCGFDILLWSRFRTAIMYILIKVLAEQHIVKDKCSFVDRLNIVTSLLTDGAFLSEQQIHYTQNCKCSDSRDRIYALLSIIDRNNDLEIVVDYRKAVDEVYQDFALKYYNRKRNFAILTFCELQNLPPGRPSWVPNWAIRSLAVPLTATNASGSSPACLKYMGGNILQVIGVTAAVIESAECLTLPDTNDFVAAIRRVAPRVLKLYGDHSLDIYLKTLLCEMYDTYGHLIAGNLVPSSEESKDILRSVLGLDEMPVNWPVNHRRFLDHAGLLTNCRSFFWTEDGRIGLGPEIAKATDEVVVIAGCHSPMILRPSHNGNGRYQVVGECFVHNLMDAEALLGPLPTGYQRVGMPDTASIRYRFGYRNNSTGGFQREDPRFGLMQNAVRDDGTKRFYPTGFPGSKREEGYIGLEMWTSNTADGGEKVEVVRNDLKHFLLE